MTDDADLHRRLLYILHRALIEIRLLSAAGRHQQVHDLADAVEQLPSWLASWRPEHLAELRRNLKIYRDSHPQSFEYVEYLDDYDVPDY